MKRICVLGISIFVYSCMSLNVEPSMEKQNTKGHWVVKPTNNEITIIGVSNLMERNRRDDEIAAAKEDAAKKAAMYYGVQGRVETIDRVGPGFFDYKVDYRAKVVYDDNYTKYIEQLIFDPNKDVLRTNEAVFIRFKLATAAKRISYKTKMDSNGRPTWINYRQFPKDDGFIMAVGFAQRQRWLKDAVYKATIAAVASILEINAIEVEDVVFEKGSGFSSDSGHAISEGKLKDFHVIELWIDPETKQVYTLAVGRPVQ